MSLLQILADNPNLLAELREVLEKSFLSDSPRTDDQITDAQLGQMYRARIVGLQKIDDAFREIAKHKTPEPMTMRPRPR